MTQAETIRSNASRILPWLTAKKNTGKKYTYEEILLNVGLPSDKNMRRSLSKFVLQNGDRRRRECTRRKPSTKANEPIDIFPPEVETIPIHQELQVKEAKVAYTYRPYASDAERFRIAWEAAGNLFAQIYFQEGK